MIGDTITKKMMYVARNVAIFMSQNFLNSKILANFASAIGFPKLVSVAKT